MKRLALLFLFAVLIPCTVLAWLAHRSMQEEEAGFERQHVLLAQEKSAVLAARCRDLLREQLREFEEATDALAVADGANASDDFDKRVQNRWVMAEKLERSLVETSDFARTDIPTNEPAPQAAAAMKMAREVLTAPQPEQPPMADAPAPAPVVAGNAQLDELSVPELRSMAKSPTDGESERKKSEIAAVEDRLGKSKMADTKSDKKVAEKPTEEPSAATKNIELLGEIRSAGSSEVARRVLNRSEEQKMDTRIVPREFGGIGRRLVTPQHLSQEAQQSLAGLSVISQGVPNLGERMRTEKSGIVGTADGDGGWQLIAWCRAATSPEVLWKGTMSMPKFLEALKTLIVGVNPVEENLCLAILDQQGKPVYQTETAFQGDWNHPYVSTEIGPDLPRWEAAAYLLAPDALLRTAQAARWKLGFMVLAVLAAAIGGAVLFWMEARRRWQEAQQKADFVSQVSHELRTPLTAIQMFSDMLAQEAPAPDAEKSQRYAQVISEEARRLTRLIDSVLDFSKLDRHGAKLQLSECDLTQIVNETMARYRPHLEKLGFAVSVELPSQPMMLQADADRVAQVLVNLLSNAEKYAVGGGHLEVALRADPMTRQAVISVADRGPGIAAGQEKLIFKKFYRADNDLHSGAQGTGLGLTLARALARAHDGEVSFLRREGGGSEFLFTLPLRQLASD